MKPTVMRYRKVGWLVKAAGIICLLLVGRMRAEAQKLQDTISIREVKITGERKIEEAGMMVTRIDTMVMQTLKTQTVSELLSSYTPVFIKSYGRGSEATASFRGTAASHTQVYWNGLRVNSAMRGDVDFALFPVYFIDDLSLQHGGSSLQSGSGALGGSVLIENRPDWNDRLSIRYVQTLESFSTYKEYLNLGFGNGRWQFKTRVFSDRSENDFPFYNYGVLPMHDDIQKNAQYNKSGLLQEVYSRFNSQTVSAKLWAYQSDRNLPQLMSFEGSSRNETQQDQHIRGVVNWKNVKEKSKLEWLVGFNRLDLNYFRSSTEDNFVNFDTRSKERSITSQFDYDWSATETLSFKWSLNASYTKVSSLDQVTKNGYDEDQLALSLLNSTHLMLSPNWAAFGLLRSEWYDGRVVGLIPSVGSEYWLDKEQQSSFKLNISRNYHQPILNDRYWLPGGNPDLKPEDGWSGDLAFAFKRTAGLSSFAGQVTGFASLINNWILWQPSRSGATYWEAGNIRKVFARGVEVYVSDELKWANGLAINLRGNYSHTATANMDALPSIDKSRGKQLIYIPKYKGNLFAEASFKNYYLIINTPFVGKRYTTSNNSDETLETLLNPYGVNTLTMGKRINYNPIQTDVSLKIENITDQDYMAILNRPMPGRYYSVTVQIQFKK